MITISHKIELVPTTSRRATSARHSVAPVLLIIGGLPNGNAVIRKVIK